MMGDKSFVFRFADVEVHEREFCLVKGGEVLPVEPKAFRVLLFLLYNPRKLIPKDELLDLMWGHTAVSENSLARSMLCCVGFSEMTSTVRVTSKPSPPSGTGLCARLRFLKAPREIRKRPIWRMA